MLEIEKYANSHEDLLWLYYTYTNAFERNKITNIKEFIENEIIYKIVCVSNEDEINKIKKQLPTIIKDYLQITSSESTRIEFVKKDMTKIQAIIKLMEMLNIKKEEIIVIGDGENDIDMIKFAGCGVAMGNASMEAKKVAKLITDTNDNDGVGKILNSLFKGE